MEALDYGVCRLAVVPIRKEPREKSEQQTQLLFGDHYEVVELSPDRKWNHIRIYADHSEGWLDVRQHHGITPEYFNQINATDYKITTEVSSAVLYKKNALTIVMGSVVPISSSELFKIEEQFAFNGESKSLGQKRDVDFLKTMAKKYLQSPVQAGGKSPFGLDASGFIQMIFKITGYTFPRFLQQQTAVGKKLKDFGEAVAGDIVFFSEGDQQISHVGLIMDKDKVIHASGHVRIDPLTEEGILDPDKKIYTHFLHSVRRIIS